VTSFGISLLPPPPQPEAKTHAEWKSQFGLIATQGPVRRESLEDAKGRSMNESLIPSMRQKSAFRTPAGSERVRSEQSRQKREGLKKLKRIKESVIIAPLILPRSNLTSTRLSAPLRFPVRVQHSARMHQRRTHDTSSQQIAKLEEKITKHKLVDQEAYFHQVRLRLPARAS
jgi:hypothetical protein